MGIHGDMYYIIVIVSTVPMESKENTNNKEIIKTWLTGHHSCTLVVPREFARQYGLDEPSHVVIEGKPEGIFIKKIEL
jgi:hypothetical protein